MSIAKDTINHPAYIRRLMEAGGRAVADAIKTSEVDPPVEAGMFSYPEWVADKTYEKGDLFTYQGNPGFVRQPHTAQAHYPPFSIGVEALYGARPRQGTDGVYPYVYNMKADRDMRVRSGNGKVYLCIQPADPLLYDPKDVPAHFEEETE